MIDNRAAEKRVLSILKFFSLIPGTQRWDSKREGLSDPYARPKEPVWLRCTLWKRLNPFRKRGAASGRSVFRNFLMTERVDVVF